MNIEQLKRELSDLVLLSLDGQLDDEQVARLNELIILSPQLREYYLSCLSVQIGLSSIEVQDSESYQGFNSDNVLRDIVEAQLAVQLDDSNEIKVPEIPQSTYQRKAISPLAICHVIGAIAALVAVAILLNVLGPKEIDRNQIATSTNEPEEKILAKVIAASQLEWFHGDKSVTVNQSLKEGHYDIQFGYARLKTNDNVEIVLEAPVSFELVSDSLMAIDQGKCSVYVPKGAEGFKVETPNASFLDLGTDFGVEVNDDGSELYVFDGKVAFYPGPKTTMDKRNFELFQTGQAGRVALEAKTITSVDFTQNKIVRKVPCEYEFIVKKTAPVAFWRFDEDKSEMALNSVGSHLAYKGLYQGNVEFGQGPRFGDADKFSAIKLDGNDSFVHIPDLQQYISPQYRGYSYSMWVKPDFVPDDSNVEDKYYLFVGYGRYGHLLISGEGYITHQFIRGGSVDVGQPYDIQKSVEKVKQGQWHHVVVTAEPNQEKKLYVDGKKCGPFVSMEGGGSICKEIYIGNIYKDSISYKPSSHDKSFKGDIAEVALYDRALTEKEIQELYQTK
ncbi:MAG: FecR domain-containing protein [Phycisphaerae bacterium]|nr:FecR domain-containing protein [Phycisphaerae bacterium]